MSLPKNPNEEEKTDIDITQGDWKKSNGPVYYSSSKKLWYCIDCKLLIKSEPESGDHAKKKHNLLSIAEQKRLASEEGRTIGSRKDLGPEELRRIFEKQGSKQAIVDPADLALQINAEEEAHHIHSLIKNPYINFYYAKARDQRMIYPDWTLADCLREGFLLFMNKLGIYINFGQDMEALKQDATFQGIAIKIAEAWKQYDIEMSLESTKPVEVTTGD